MILAYTISWLRLQILVLIVIIDIRFFIVYLRPVPLSGLKNGMDAFFA
jgi:hypothetical protein